MRDVLATQRRLLGETHADTRATVTSLCQVLSEQSVPEKREEALALMRAQVANLEECCGADSAVVMSDLHTLAAMLSFEKRPGEAESLQRRILAYRTRVFGEKGHETLAAMNNLAFTLRAIGKTAEAIELYQRALPLLEEVLGPEHNLFLTATHNLGSALAQAGRHEDAFRQLEKAWELGRTSKGETHPETLSSRMHLADCHFELGNIEACVKHYAELVPPSREVLGETHPEAILRANNLAFYLEKAGRLAEAETVWREVCEAGAARYGSDSLKLAHYLEQLDSNLRQQQKWKEVMPVLKRQHEIRERHHGPNERHAQEQRLVELILHRKSGGKMTPELEQEFVRLFNAVYAKNVTQDDVRADRERRARGAEGEAEEECPGDSGRGEE